MACEGLTPLQAISVATKNPAQPDSGLRTTTGRWSLGKGLILIALERDPSHDIRNTQTT